MSAEATSLPLSAEPAAAEGASADAGRATPIVGAGGRWVLHQGDALAVLRSMPDASVDAVITDPPYSSGGFTRGDRSLPPAMKYTMNGTKIERPTFAGDNRDQRSFGYWCALWLGECLRVAKPGAPLCVFTDWRQLPTMTDAIQAGGWVWRGIVDWVSLCTFLSSTWNYYSVRDSTKFDTGRRSTSGARVDGRAPLPRSHPLAWRITPCSHRP